MGETVFGSTARRASMNVYCSATSVGDPATGGESVRRLAVQARFQGAASKSTYRFSRSMPSIRSTSVSSSSTSRAP